MIDARDAKILNILQVDARTPQAAIARRLGVAPSAVLERLRKLERRGLIRGYTARLDPQPLGLGLLAFVFVRTGDRLGAVSAARRLARLPEVQEVHTISGEDCFLVKVRAADPEALGRLLREKIGGIPSVRSTRTTIVLESHKETSHLPVAASPRRGRG